MFVRIFFNPAFSLKFETNTIIENYWDYEESKDILNRRPVYHYYLALRTNLSEEEISENRLYPFGLSNVLIYGTNKGTILIHKFTDYSREALEQYIETGLKPLIQNHPRFKLIESKEFYCQSTTKSIHCAFYFVFQESELR